MDEQRGHRRRKVECGESAYYVLVSAASDNLSNWFCAIELCGGKWLSSLNIKKSGDRHFVSKVSKVIHFRFHMDEMD